MMFRSAPRKRTITPLLVTFAATAMLVGVSAERGAAHLASLGVAGKKIKLDTSRSAAKRRLSFRSETQVNLTFSDHDPTSQPTALLVGWTGSGGQGAGRTPLIQLPAGSWRSTGLRDGFRFRDKTGSAGGVKTVVLREYSTGGRIKIDAKGAGLPIDLVGPQDSVWVHLMIEQEWYCAEFGGSISKNDGGRFRAKSAIPPGLQCPTQICGNGVVELGETCDDGNLVDDDACSNDCSSCNSAEYASTFDAIQDIVLDGYGCNAFPCHSTITQQGSLDLSAGNAYAELVNVASTTDPGTDRVEPGDQDGSVLYDKLHAGTFDHDPIYGGGPMPTGGALTEAHLEAVELWIRGGAPEDLTVTGTADLLATCLPEPDPLTIPPPDPPGAGVGAQFRMTPWPLPAQSEDEICMVTYYDLTQTNLVPDEMKISCSLGLANNPSGECFMWHKQTLAQDPQSHHSIIDVYTGAYDTTDPGWGAWTYKFQDQSNPLEGQPCEPTEVDPATGYANDCSSSVTSSVACIGFGPPDGGATNGSAVSGSQQAYYEQEFADGVFALMPMAGIIIWNSHAFNTTTTDSTMSQYLNLDFAGPADQAAQLRRVFNISHIFDADVPPFETREYCWHHVVPKNSNLFNLSSHTHRFGIQFRIYAPPTPACTDSSTCSADDIDQGQRIYLSTDYADPDQLVFDPPWHFGNVSADERRFRFCSLYDNGSGPNSPAVKRNSNPLGSGCGTARRACMAGPNKGELCGNEADPVAFCETSAGAADGECDACPAVGGVTTEDEMFILLGSYFFD